ncbi:G protein pathway suppressor 2 isoform X4 [Oenanthe melanoleuca]|uniref:G protein pathway suppressor 2 isoform X4 n=1 Tax=Oenanthe melanoleuca TaxID=2939378 RepID=UPI0024C1D78F|nr:G protein pathway suppressor 2 isoform X4 [Oenanthe melanoleuca]
MPALLERPKLSSAMARALHRHVMVERERKRQEEEEVDKMMEQKVREEQERRRRKELEERMSLEETREQLLKLQEKLGALQEEKHQLFLQLKKVLHEEEKRRRKEQSDLTTLTAAAYPQGLGVPGAHLLGMAGSPGGPRSGLIGADRAKQMFGPPVISPPPRSRRCRSCPSSHQGAPSACTGTSPPPSQGSSPPVRRCRYRSSWNTPTANQGSASPPCTPAPPSCPAPNCPCPSRGTPRPGTAPSSPTGRASASTTSDDVITGHAPPSRAGVTSPGEATPAAG